MEFLLFKSLPFGCFKGKLYVTGMTDPTTYCTLTPFINSRLSYLQLTAVAFHLRSTKQQQHSLGPGTFNRGGMMS